MNIIFAGTPDFAAGHLQALVESDHTIVAVYTQPDRPANRGKKMMPSPVKVVAEEHNIPVYQPINFKDEADVEQLKALNADLMIVVAYGLLLPKSVLEAPKQGCINVHASLLPRWRGAAPIQRSIQAGDDMTGITIMQMDEGLDTGDMLHKTFLPIDQQDTGGSLHDKLLDQGPYALLNALDMLEKGRLNPEKQDDSQANYASKLSKQEALINWQDSAQQIALNVRAFNPFPMAFTLLGDERIRVIEAQAIESRHSLMPGTIISVDKAGVVVACKEGQIILHKVQLAGKKPMTIADILNGQNELFKPLLIFSSQM